MTQIVSPFVVAVKALFMAEVSAAHAVRKDTAQPTIERVANSFSGAMTGLNGTLVSRAELICGMGIACGQVLSCYDHLANQSSDDADLEKLILILAGAVVVEYQSSMAARSSADLLGKAFKEASRGKP